MATADQTGTELELDSLNSAQSASTGPSAQKKRVSHRFSSWAFQLTLSADATALTGGRESGSVTLQERKKILLEHVRSRMENTISKPDIVTFIEAFYDTSIISGAQPAGISISIPLLGYVQTRAHTTCEISTMQYWISASWSPVPGGLSSNQQFKDNRR
jgi:hypothetical protein